MNKNVLSITFGDVVKDNELDTASIESSLTELSKTDQWPKSWPVLDQAVVRAVRTISAYLSLRIKYTLNPHTPDQTSAVAALNHLPLDQIAIQFMEIDDARVLDLNKAREFHGMTSTFVLFEPR